MIQQSKLFVTILTNVRRSYAKLVAYQATPRVNALDVDSVSYQETYNAASRHTIRNTEITPLDDKSPQESNKQILPAPTIKIPDTEDNKAVNIHQYEANKEATIRKLQHVLPLDEHKVTNKIDTNIEFIEMYDDQPNVPTIKTFHNLPTKQTLKTKTTYTNINPLLINILTDNGEVNKQGLNELQYHLIRPTSLQFFKTHCK